MCFCLSYSYPRCYKGQKQPEALRKGQARARCDGSCPWSQHLRSRGRRIAHELKASLAYLVSSRPALATCWEFIKNNSNKNLLRGAGLRNRGQARHSAFLSFTVLLSSTVPPGADTWNSTNLWPRGRGEMSGRSLGLTTLNPQIQFRHPPHTSPCKEGEWLFG